MPLSAYSKEKGRKEWEAKFFWNNGIDFQPSFLCFAKVQALP